jgi:hypothetical protein
VTVCRSEYTNAWNGSRERSPATRRGAGLGEPNA